MKVFAVSNCNHFCTCKEDGICKDGKRQRHRDRETERQRDTEAKRHRDTEAQARTHTQASMFGLADGGGRV